MDLCTGDVPGGVEGGEDVVIDAASRGRDDMVGDDDDEGVGVGTTPQYSGRFTGEEDRGKGGAAVQVARDHGTDFGWGYEK